MLYAAGAILIFTGIGHLVLASRGTRAGWRSIARGGWLAAVVLVPQTDEEHERSASFWATAGSFGFPFVLLGALVVWLASEGREPPQWLGWGVLAYGVLTTSIATRGGFWGIIAGAVLLLAASYT